MAKRTKKSPAVPALTDLDVLPNSQITLEQAALNADLALERAALEAVVDALCSAEEYTPEQLELMSSLPSEEPETTDLISGEPMPCNDKEPPYFKSEQWKNILDEQAAHVEAEEQTKPEFSPGIKNLLKRLRLTAQDELWGSVRVNQEGDRFSISFPPDFYNTNRQACYSFSGRLAKVSRMRGARSATFDLKGFLVILVSSPQDTSVI